MSNLALPATLAELEALLTDAYAAGREDERMALELGRLLAEGEQYQREQIASANSLTSDDRRYT